MAQIRLKGDRFKAFSKSLLAPLCCHLQKAQTTQGTDWARPEILQARPKEPSKIAKPLLLHHTSPFPLSLAVRTHPNPSADHGGTWCILLFSTGLPCSASQIQPRGHGCLPKHQTSALNEPLANQTGRRWCYPGSSVPAANRKTKTLVIVSLTSSKGQTMCSIPSILACRLTLLTLPSLLQPFLSPQWMVLLPLHSSPRTNWNTHSAPAD